MAKKGPDLDTPFTTGETVLLARPVRGIPDGTEGRIKLVNGLEGYEGSDPWIRYWVRFPGHGLVGQVSHDDLARPFQYGAWLDREEERIRLANMPDEPEEPTPDTGGGGDASGGSGIASQIPEHLLERSRAAKARLLGS